MVNLKLSYKPLKITLLMKDKTMGILKKELCLAPATIAKLNKDEYVALSVIHRVCEYLECPVQDVMEFVEDSNEAKSEL
ncbi:helix-turn-helix domain-containing protein [Bacillus atrophaeus]|uniref:helix-turn-helix domain-containing protein n=1 Tax=Bacillus atrophaeus TaxID=1452 RepID=UPI0022806264|nr:helix-turn-helix transcriptional regulator [Bacillus atrophaeus]MCY7948056.1 helix-turn-helix transcriptional regulator [Bacillus atrophaeus]MCY8098379.1 helix-turn-helix transcriptional regulator [Bacillus atrophaeus]MCY9169922.1 helix-turn-helix transcriptional regulator [Bacillus atrophaeus]MEC0740647.1 helix-turn-helix transcriptional regulator [Bacillus atrophaeus]MEC0747089.1 helix-turn-helix transcriptional regulator [Bacillus atrophaeus]